MHDGIIRASTNNFISREGQQHIIINNHLSKIKIYKVSSDLLQLREINNKDEVLFNVIKQL